MSSSRRFFSLLAAAAIAIAAWGCAPGEGGAARSEHVRMVFINSGICITGYSGSAEITDLWVTTVGGGIESSYSRHGDALLIECAWRGGEQYSVTIEATGSAKAELSATAPRTAGLAPLRIIPLDPRNNSAAEPSAAAIDEAGRWCAVGTNGGELLLIDLESGEPKAWEHSAGAYIRSLEFARAGEDLVLLAGEQSPRGTVAAYAVGEGDLRRLWSHETAQEIGSSLRDPNDPYSWAHLPGVYRIAVRGERALVLAVHPEFEAEAEKRSLLYCVDLATGGVEWSWPRGGTLPAIATWFDADEAGELIALCCYGSDGDGGEIIALGGDGSELGRLEIEPLRPQLEKVSFWRSVAVGRDGVVGAMSDDGRAWLWRPGREAIELVLVEPIEVAGMPLLVSGAGAFSGHGAMLFATGVSYIPWHLSGGRQPQQPHPDALKLMAFNADGEPMWVASVPSLLQGLASGPDGRWLFAGYASDPQFAPAGGSGLAVFDSTVPWDLLEASYPVAGSVMHGSPLSAAGGRLVLLVETAQLDAASGKIKGAHAVHLLAW